MNRSVARSVAIAISLLITVSLLPAAAAGNEPESPDLERYARRYLSIVCPVNRQNDRAYDAWIRAFGSRSVRYGTPVPRFLRQQHRKSVKVYSRAAVRMNRAYWPAPIQDDIYKITKEYYSAVPFYRSRDTAKVSRSWKKHMYDAGNAGTRVRMWLKLPPAGEGC